MSVRKLDYKVAQNKCGFLKKRNSQRKKARLRRNPFPYTNLKHPPPYLKTWDTPVPKTGDSKIDELTSFTIMYEDLVTSSSALEA